MNEFCKYNIKKFYQLFQSREFDQNDVAFFISLSRDYSQKGSIFRELGDFLAHPKRKDRGLVINSINDYMYEFDAYLTVETQSNEELCNKLPNFRGFDFNIYKEILKCLNQIFTLTQLKPLKIDEEDLAFREFIFCLIFLLSYFKIKLNGELIKLEVAYSGSLKLEAKCESNFFSKSFAIIPILTIRNLYPDSTPYFHRHLLSNMVARRFEEGFLAAIPIDKDNFNRKLNLNNFINSEVWPINVGK